MGLSSKRGAATIEARNLSRYGPKLAVDDLTFTVAPGKVTGFLGPNGAGKPNPGKRQFFSCDCRRRRTRRHRNRAPCSCPHSAAGHWHPALRSGTTG
jgi:hypothetical protein